MAIRIDPSLDHQDAERFARAPQNYAHLTSPWVDLFTQKPEKDESVTIIGAGIQGIMAAYLTKLQGYDVTLVDRNPDPRTTNKPIESATFGGEDSRYITIFEGHPYLRLAGYTEKMYPDMKEALATAAKEGGWLAKSPEAYRPLMQQWIQERFRAHDAQAAIKQLFADYVQENRVSMQIWYEFMRQNPGLHPRIDLHDEILRLYDNKDLLETARISHEREEVLLATLNADELAKLLPAYKPGVDETFLVGALTMNGLTLRVKELCKYLLDTLDTLGTHLEFNTEILAPQRENGRITAIPTKDGRMLQSKHFAFYTGAYADPEIYKESPVHGKIAGVAGYWVEWKNISPELLEAMKDLPYKIHGGVLEREGKKRPVVDINCNIVKEQDGSTTLLIGSGYAAVGHPPFEVDAQAQQEIFKDVHTILDKVYGDAYRAALNAGDIQNSDNVCVRSWSITDEQLQNFERTGQGGIASHHGGGNTGSTNNAPFEALSLVTLLHSFTELEGKGKTTRHSINAELRKLHGVAHSLLAAQDAPGSLTELVQAVLKTTLTDTRGVNRIA